MTGRAIKTVHEYPPIPDRRFDWCAFYDGEEEAGHYGWGRTEAEAIADFNENYREMHDERLSPSDHVRLVSTGPGPDAAVDAKLELDTLCGAFGGLSDSHHEILVLRELEGLSYEEIAEVLGTTVPAVKGRLHRARLALLEAIGAWR